MLDPSHFEIDTMGTQNRFRVNEITIFGVFGMKSQMELLVADEAIVI